MAFPGLRMRRLRRTPRLRDLVGEVTLSSSDLVYPLFVEEGLKAPKPIPSMPDQFTHPPEGVVKEGRGLVSLGLPALLLFGLPKKKDDYGSAAYDGEGVVQRTLRALRRVLGDDLVLITDVCLCQYTTHGHCGVVEGGVIKNDPTLKLLGKIAVSHAEAGADIVAPSAMIDGQVKAIRESLDDGGFSEVAIMAYSAKHASSFYGPFREAAQSKPPFGDRRSYQMDYRNPTEALREVELDVEEGADIVMVKPALAYLDIISKVRSIVKRPLAAFNVSGEYAMVKAAAERGWVDEEAAALEVVTAIKRAGADIILTYHAKDLARWIRSSD